MLFMQSGRSVAPAWIQGLLYLLERKASILQKTRLPGAFAQTLRQLAAVLPAADAPDLFDPVVAGDIQPAPDHVRGHAFFLQFLLDAQRPAAALAAHPHERLHESLVGQQALGFQARGHLRGQFRGSLQPLRRSFTSSSRRLCSRPRVSQR